MICSVQVERVIDGDTFKAAFGEKTISVRVVGINTPERGEKGFAEATQAANEYFQDLYQIDHQLIQLYMLAQVDK
ncbi:MAG: hypothetical protein EBS74_09890, partial [Flavobacteriia bacterium]|nr:hypothetical protein [Flavobacteriia bacterium]